MADTSLVELRPQTQTAQTVPGQKQPSLMTPLIKIHSTAYKWQAYTDKPRPEHRAAPSDNTNIHVPKYDNSPRREESIFKTFILL